MLHLFRTKLLYPRYRVAVSDIFDRSYNFNSFFPLRIFCPTPAVVRPGRRYMRYRGESAVRPEAARARPADFRRPEKGLCSQSVCYFVRFAAAADIHCI